MQRLKLRIEESGEKLSAAYAPPKWSETAGKGDKDVLRTESSQEEMRKARVSIIALTAYDRHKQASNVHLNRGKILTLLENIHLYFKIFLPTINYYLSIDGKKWLYLQFRLCLFSKFQGITIPTIFSCIW